MTRLARAALALWAVAWLACGYYAPPLRSDRAEAPASVTDDTAHDAPEREDDADGS